MAVGSDGDESVMRDAGSGGGAGDRGQSRADRVQLDELERLLSEHLGTRVEIRPGRNPTAGRMVLHFYDLDQFDGLLSKMSFSGS